MKTTFAKIILVIAFLLVGTSVYALTLADIELLVALGIISGEQAEIAKEAISTGTDSGSAGSIIKPNAFTATECLILNQNMLLGSSGTAVSAVQNFLRQQGHYTNPEITTYFGTATKTAVIDFQIATGLITSSSQPGAGSIGPLTREKIQEVSCNAVNNPVVLSPNDPLLNIDREDRALVPQTRKTGELEISLQSTLVFEDRDAGIRDYRYTMNVDIANNDLVKNWRVTLICDENDIELRRLNVRRKNDIEKCGDSAIYRASTKGDKSIKIKYINVSAATQAIGVGIEALDGDDNLLGVDDVIDNVPPKKPKGITTDSQGFQIVPGTNGEVIIPRQRICGEAEQIAFLKFTMTKTIRVGNPIAPPSCWPGNVRCTYDHPPSYCSIVNGPSAEDLCYEHEFFYDGECLDRSNY